MNIIENPFYILEVSAKHNREQIKSVAEEKIFMNDSASESINEAVNTLIIANKRLAAEIRWFPGIDYLKIKDLVEFFRKLNSGKPAKKIDMSSLRGISLLNFAVYMFRFRKFKDIYEILKSFLAMGKCYDTLNTQSVCSLINNERIAAGFHVAEEAEIDRELHNYRSDVINTLHDKLLSLSESEYMKLAEEISMRYADKGAYHGSLILSGLLDCYELHIKPQLEKYEDEILSIISGISEKSEINPEILLLHLRNWKRIIRPLLLASITRGMKNDTLYGQGVNFLNALRKPCGKMLNVLSDFSVEINEKQRRIKYVMLLTMILQENLKDIAQDLSEQIDSDINQLKALYDKGEKIKEDIYYERQLGLTFKSKFIISADGIKWNEIVTPLNNITGIRWGGIIGNRTTTYEIACETPEHTIILKPGKKEYEDIIEHLWKALASSLFTKILKRLHDGETLYIGRIKFNDKGVFLQKSVASSSEQKFFTWSEPLILHSDNGLFFIEIQEKNITYYANSSYVYDMNTHILDSMLHQFYEHIDYSNPVLSCLL